MIYISITDQNTINKITNNYLSIFLLYIAYLCYSTINLSNCDQSKHKNNPKICFPVYIIFFIIIFVGFFLLYVQIITREENHSPNSSVSASTNEIVMHPQVEITTFEIASVT